MPGGFVAQMRECGEKAHFFAWIARATSSVDSARDALTRIRKTVKGAYLKRCDVSLGTLLALRITAVDGSIADVPLSAVNWEDEDRISSALPLPDGRTFVAARYFLNDPEDPLEGRRTRVILAAAPQQRVVLLENCTRPDRAVTQRGLVAFQCASEQAGEHLLHNVVVFDSTGHKLLVQARCREPSWTADCVISCKAESVGPDGRLALHARVARVVRGK